MADNVAITAGSGTSIATDQVGSDHYQLIKLAFGALDTATLVTSSVGLPVGDAGGSLTVDAPVGTPVFVRLSDGASAITTLAVSAASLPLPSGAATSANQTTELASLASIDGKLPALGQALAAASVPVVLTAAQISTLTPLSTVTVNAGSGTFAVSAASLPLPSGAATAAKQPALGTAGTASADVITIQGIASMTAVKVDNSAVTQPVAGVAAHDAAVSGNPVLLAGEARESNGTAVSTGDVVRLSADRLGRLHRTKPKLSRAASNGTPITTATDTSVVSAPSASSHTVVHRLHATNAGSTSTYVYWRDGVSGTKLYGAYLAQGATISITLEGSWHLTGGGTPLALYLTTSAAGSVEWTVEYETIAD